MKYRERYRMEHAGELADRLKRLKLYKVILGNLLIISIAVIAIGFCAVDYNPEGGTVAMMLGTIAIAVISFIGDHFDKQEENDG